MSFGLSMTKFPRTGSRCQSAACDPTDMKLHRCDDTPWKFSTQQFSCRTSWVFSCLLNLLLTPLWFFVVGVASSFSHLTNSAASFLHTWSTRGRLPSSFVQIILFTWLCLAAVSPPALHSLVSLASISAWLFVLLYVLFPFVPSVLVVNKKFKYWSNLHFRFKG